MLKSRTANKIIAAIAAITLWAYVITVENPQMTQVIKDVPVSFTNLEALASKGLTISNETAGSYSLDVLVEGKRADVAKLTKEDIVAEANLLGYAIGERSVPVDVTAPESIKVIEKRPSKITVTLEELVTVNKEIKVEFTGSFSSDEEPGFLTMMPEEIEVSGAKSEVDEVLHIRAEIDGSQLTQSSKTFTVEAIPIGKNNEPVNNMKLSQQEIEVKARLCSTKVVGLDVSVIGEVPPEYEVAKMNIPERVKIRGSENALEDIDIVSAQAIDISGIDVTSKIPLELILPDGIEVADGSKDISIEVEIKGIATKELDYASNEITIEGVTGKYTAHINTGNVKVTVFGSENAIASITKSDIELFVDMSNVNPENGSADLPLQLKYEKALTRIVMDPETVRVIVNADV